MIPAFDSNGNLPPGVHLATLDEIEARFGVESELRRVQMESLRWLVEMSVQAGVLRLAINGSFVTQVAEPNDVDCVLLVDEDFFAKVESDADLWAVFPFLDIHLVNDLEFKGLVNVFFATDRHAIHKGLVEVVL